MGTEVVAAVVTVLAFRPHAQEVANRWVVTHLLAVYLSAVRIAALQCFPDDGIELAKYTITGLRNIVM